MPNTAAGPVARLLRRLSGSGYRLGLVMALLGFGALWVHDLGRFAFSSDEAASALMADMPLGGIQRQNEDSPHVPVDNLLLWAWRLTVGGQSELLLRLPSVLLGLLLLSLIFRLARDLGLSELGALGAVLLVGLNPQIVYHLREARPYAPMLTSLALAAVIAVRFERLPHRWLAALTSLLALLTHYFNIPFIGALGLWGLLTLKGRARRDWIITQAVAAALFAIWLPLMGRAFFNPTSLNSGKTWSFLLPPWETLGRLAVVAAQGYREYANWGLALLAAALLLGGWLVGGWALTKRSRWFLWLLGGLPLLAYALLAWVRPVFHPKYMLPWLVSPALGWGAWLTRQPRRAGLAAGLLALLMVMPTWRTLQQPYDPGVTTTADLTTGPRDLGQGVLALAGPHDVFAFGTPDSVHCYYFQHYFDRALDCALLPRDPAQTSADLTRQIDDLLSAHDVLWYLDYLNPAWDPRQQTEKLLGQEGLGLGQTTLADRTLKLYVSPATVGREQQNVAVQFGGVAELSGVWTLPGDGLRSVLIWKALADRPAVNAKVFLHWVDAAGHLIGQDDSLPVSWTRPLATWRMGETLYDIHVLAGPSDQPSAGTRLQIGLYNADTLKRLPAVDQDGQRLPDDAAVVTVTSARSP